MCGYRPILSLGGVWLSLAMLFVTGCPDDTSPQGPGPGDDDDGTGLWGDDCVSSDDCLSPLVCGGNGTCLNVGEPGTAGPGEDCVSSEYCLAGLVCDHDGTCAEPGDSGTGGSGDSCQDDLDCQAMLECIEGSCHGFQIPLWLGAECTSYHDETGPFRVYFEVPGDEPLNEFYRLPFPNDARFVNGQLDLSGHPSPGALVDDLGDVTGSMLDAMEQDLTAFGNNHAALLRLSGKVDWETVVIGEPGIGTLYMVDITEGTEEYGTKFPTGFRGSGERRAYICENWISIDPSDGRPYLPGHTYAAVITEGVKQRDYATAAAQDEDFAEVMSITPPVDTRLTRAWEAYAPFRSWLTDAGIDASLIAGAAVFTVGDPREPLQAVYDAVQETSEPTISGGVLCELGGDDPYDDPADESRGCNGESSSYFEIQGTVDIPQFQVGAPPFKTPDDGGQLNLVGGVPTPLDSEQVIFSLTIPKGVSMPAGGWPLVLYGHGTGGNYRCAINDGVAEALADVELDDGTHVNFAVLSIDAVLHGPRAHPENWDSAWALIDPSAYDADVLQYNVLNPRAARDTPLQAAADGFQLVRLAQSLMWDAGESLTGQAIDFDADEIHYMGHSLGAVHGVSLVAQEPAIRSAVFSGGGAATIEALVNKQETYDLAGAMMVVLADPDLDRHHPMLNLIQALDDPGDGINQARYVFRETPAGSPRKHVLQMYGLGDTVSPEEIQVALAKGLYVEQVTNGNPAVDGLSQEELPVDGNASIDGDHVTGIVALYQPNAGSDGHTVIFDLAAAQTQYTQFLATAVRDGIPTVVQP